MTRALFYPPADRTSQSYSGGRYGGSTMELAEPVAVLHTTEGIGWPGYGGGSMAPTLTMLPIVSERRCAWRQHFRINESGRALENKMGGVQTNTQGAIQVEMVGTCDPASPVRRIPGAIYWPEAPDWCLQGVADFLAWCHDEWGLQLTSDVPWLAYGPDPRRPGVTPASYGASPARMSFAQWEAFAGVCGHQHVPENVHGDPGAFPIERVLSMARGGNITPSPGAPAGSTTPRPTPIVITEDDMPRLVQYNGGQYAADGSTRTFWKVGPGAASIIGRFGPTVVLKDGNEWTYFTRLFREVSDPATPQDAPTS